MKKSRSEAVYSNSIPYSQLLTTYSLLPSTFSICSCKYDPLRRRFPGEHALAFLLRIIQRYATDRRFGFFFDRLLAFRRAVPMRVNESAFFQRGFEVGPRVNAVGRCVAAVECAL